MESNPVADVEHLADPWNPVEPDTLHTPAGVLDLELKPFAATRYNPLYHHRSDHRNRAQAFLQGACRYDNASIEVSPRIIAKQVIEGFNARGFEHISPARTHAGKKLDVGIENALSQSDIRIFET